MQGVPNLVNQYVAAIFKSTLYASTSITLLVKGKDAVVKAEKIDDGKLVKKDSWCKKNPYDIIPATYASTTYTFTAGSPFV
jgi:hypothetical protein